MVEQTYFFQHHPGWVRNSVLISNKDDDLLFTMERKGKDWVLVCGDGLAASVTFQDSWLHETYYHVRSGKTKAVLESNRGFLSPTRFRLESRKWIFDFEKEFRCCSADEFAIARDSMPYTFMVDMTDGECGPTYAVTFDDKDDKDLRASFLTACGLIVHEESMRRTRQQQTSGFAAAA